MPTAWVADRRGPSDSRFDDQADSGVVIENDKAGYELQRVSKTVLHVLTATCTPDPMGQSAKRSPQVRQYMRSCRCGPQAGSRASPAPTTYSGVLQSNLVTPRLGSEQVEVHAAGSTSCLDSFK